MRIWLKLAALAGVLAVAAGARCADFAGTWKGAFDFQGNSVPLTFHLSLAGNAVTGTVEGLPTTPAEIHDGRIDGDTVTFSVNTDYQGENYKLVFKGSAASGDGSIHFTLGTEDGSWSSELVAEKAAASGDSAGSAPAAPAAANSANPAQAAAADVSGTWKGSFDYQGTAVPVTFHFTAKDNALTGTIEGMMEGAPDKPAEIEDGTVTGGAISFAVNTQYQGETYRIVYRGKVDGGDKIDFTFGTEDGSWSNQLTATRTAESASQ
ncbi:MAG TPA: hypothetical protein VKU93_02060 [Terracidiphilus sp.]|nr:hypothetical protein [Terracidiphilus sp.]